MAPDRPGTRTRRRGVSRRRAGLRYFSTGARSALKSVSHWVDERVASSLIRCLFRAVQNLTRVRNLKVLVALPTNIFPELEFSERVGQEEKLKLSF